MRVRPLRIDVVDRRQRVERHPGLGLDALARAGEPVQDGGDADDLVAGLAQRVDGLQRRIEGPLLEPGERCLIVEDVVTTGGSTLQAIEAVREAGFEIVGVTAILDRLAGGGDAIREAANAPYEPLTTIDAVYPQRPDRVAA